MVFICQRTRRFVSVSRDNSKRIAIGHWTQCPWTECCKGVRKQDQALLQDKRGILGWWGWGDILNQSPLLRLKWRTVCQNQQMKTNSVAAHASWVEVLLLGADNGFESGDRDGYAPPPTASTLPLDAPVLLSQWSSYSLSELHKNWKSYIFWKGKIATNMTRRSTMRHCWTLTFLFAGNSIKRLVSDMPIWPVHAMDYCAEKVTCHYTVQCFVNMCVHWHWHSVLQSNPTKNFHTMQIEMQNVSLQ